MGQMKRIYSKWSTVVSPLNAQPNAPTIVDASRITPAILRQYGSKLVILDEASRALEYCGTGIAFNFLQSCRPRQNRIDASLPMPDAVCELYDLEKPAVAEEAPVEEPVVEEEAPKPARKKRVSKKKATKKAAEPTPVLEPDPEPVATASPDPEPEPEIEPVVMPETEDDDVADPFAE